MKGEDVDNANCNGDAHDNWYIRTLIEMMLKMMTAIIKIMLMADDDNDDNHTSNMQTYCANWKTSNTNFSILIPFGAAGFCCCPFISTNGIFFFATWCFSKDSFSLLQEISKKKKIEKKSQYWHSWSWNCQIRSKNYDIDIV